jgi:hypothetical protein
MGLALLVSLGLGSWAYGQCSNGAGSGDLDEGETCLVDLDEDTVSGGCNSTPPAFVTLSIGDFANGGFVDICGNGSGYNVNATCSVDADCDPGETCVDGECNGGDEPSVGRRDTDWYLIPQAVLADYDTNVGDDNGVVQVNSTFLNSLFNTVTFVIGITDPTGTCDAEVLTSTGCNALGGETCVVDADCPSGTCAAGTCTAENLTATETLIIADWPDGVVVFASSGECDGSSLGAPTCDTGNNDYILRIAFSEAPTACSPDAPSVGPCNEPNPAGRPGCEDPQCCWLVCQELPLCCSFAQGWDQGCADIAIDIGCAPDLGSPIFMATGPDDEQAVDGYLRVKADPFGSFATATFGGTDGGGDLYNPAGDDAGGFGPAEASFSNGYYFFIAATNQRQILANNTDWQDSIGTPDDGDVEREITQVNLETDNDGDGITDQLNSQFRLTGPGLDLTFDVEQRVANPEAAIATLTQTYTITNGLANPITFDMNRQFDGDFVWLASGATDDSTGTGTNGTPSHVWVFMQEVATAATAVTHSAAVGPGGFGAEYCGAKQFVNPSGDPPDPDCPDYAFGSDTQEWEAYGLPDCWVNHIALVGYNINGTSGDAVGADDVHTVLVQTVTVPGSGSATMEILQTYGQQTPYGLVGPPPCPCDCQTDPNGSVDVQDFLALLAQWGGPGTCDCDSPPDGVVDVQDFLAILATWGPCPE